MPTEISLFPYYSETHQHTDISIEDFLEKTRDGFWQDAVLALRTEKDDEQYKIKKLNLPNATISGTFSVRNDKSLVQHTGLVAIDIDKQDDVLGIKDILSKDAYFYALYLSCSGKGLCGLVKINPEMHVASYKQFGKYLLDKYSIVIDNKCHNLSRTRFVSYDPDLHFNPDSLQFKATKQGRPKKSEEKKEYLIVPSDFEAVIAEIVERQIDVTTEYDRWMHLGFSLATSFGEEGRVYFHQLSEVNGEYDYYECDRKYDNFLETKSGSLNIGWFYDLLKKDYNIKAYSERTEAVLRAAQAVQEWKIADGKAGVLKLLKEKHGFTDEDNEAADDIIDQALRKRIPVGGESLIGDVEVFLYHRFDIKMNSLIQVVEVDGKRLDQTKLNTMYTDACKQYAGVTMAMVRALVNTDNTPKYNPFEDLINKFIEEPPHQPYGHIQKMIDSVITDTPEAGYFIKKWMVAMIPSILGQHSVLMLVFCGRINSGKTEWFRRYLPPCLQKYRADNSLEEGKDSDILMSRKILILDDEMGGKSKAEEKRMKNMTSKQEINVRKPYDSEDSELNRIAMLCGTTNDSEILKDPTGNRRLLPVNVIDINKELYNTIDKELVIYECYLEHINGYNSRLTNEDIRILNKSTANFKASNFTDEMFDKYIGRPEDYPLSATTGMTTTEIYLYLNNITNTNKTDMTRVTALLNTLGYVNKRSGRRRDWQVVQLTDFDRDIDEML